MSPASNRLMVKAIGCFLISSMVAFTSLEILLALGEHPLVSVTIWKCVQLHLGLFAVVGASEIGEVLDAAEEKDAGNR